ncbi:MAG: ferric reductase-like transmembrane domain-containing protein [Elusimicrobia bacterium]|nr:ferric reductase-like transmembrane domain-containing protein [Elusimicrobiota bacterium]
MSLPPRRMIGDAVLALLAAAPLAWACGLGEGGPALLLLGRAAAVLGLSLLLLAAMTSVRIPGLDHWFGGLTRLWRIHHLLGAAAFLLLMAHPLLLSFAAARFSVRAASAVLFPGPSAWGVWAGWLALAVMSAFLAPTFAFFGAPEHQRWKALHALSGAALLLGLAHALSSGALLSGRAAWAWWGGYGAAALLAFGWRAFAARRFARKAYTVAGAAAAGRGIVELTLRPDGRLLERRAGQFIYLTPLDPGLAAGRGEEHPYTLSSAPDEPALRVVIKDLGDASRALQSVAVGSKALVEGPFGEFFPRDGGDAPELWIAGGIGLTPFLSRVRELSPARPADVHLVYCVQDETRAHFRAELEGVAAKVPGFRLWMHHFAREGPLTAAFLRSRCPDFAGREIFVCGPPALIAAAREELRRAGVPSARVRSEDFNWL